MSERIGPVLDVRGEPAYVEPPARAGAGRIGEHAVEFAALVAQAQEQERRGHLELAAARAQVAAEYAWLNHTGTFASDELELLLARIGATLPTVRPAPDSHGRVLHVITQTYQTGGPTQAVVQWADHSPAEHHVVCVTRQGPSELPAKLTERTRDGSVEVVRLDDRPGGLVRRARRLRALAAGVQAVFLHTHPYDVVPLMAFGGPSWEGGPVVTYVNHADHVFWLGTHCADRVMHMRASGERVALDRRGVEAGRSSVAARPLRLARRTSSRASARAAFDVADDVVLVVTAAEESKFRALSLPSYVDLLEPVVSAHPQVLVLVAGPSPSDAQWAAVAERTGARMRALGRLPDASLLQQAADIYVDSFPFASLTSLLEAGAYGVPLVSYRGLPEDCDVLASDTMGVDEHLVRPTTPQELARDLGALIADGPARSALGARTAEAVLHVHEPAVWRAAVEPLMHPVPGATRPARPVASAARVDELDIRIDEVMSRSQFSSGSAGAQMGHLGHFPAGVRVATWLRLAREGTRPPWSALVPDWWLPPVARVARGTKRRLLRVRRSDAPGPGGVVTLPSARRR